MAVHVHIRTERRREGRKDVIDTAGDISLNSAA